MEKEEPRKKRSFRLRNTSAEGHEAPLPQPGVSGKEVYPAGADEANGRLRKTYPPGAGSAQAGGAGPDAGSRTLDDSERTIGASGVEEDRGGVRGKPEWGPRMQDVFPEASGHRGPGGDYRGDVGGLESEKESEHEGQVPPSPPGESAGQVYPPPPGWYQPPYTPYQPYPYGPFYPAPWYPMAPVEPLEGVGRKRKRRKVPEAYGYPPYYPPYFAPPGAHALAAPPLMTLPEEQVPEEGFLRLTGEEAEARRADLKWLFGVVAAFVLLIALVLGAFFIVSTPGNSKRVISGLLSRTTGVRDAVVNNYRELRSRARLRPQASFLIPDIGVDVFVKGKDISSMSVNELEEWVIAEITRVIYKEGYVGGLPMKTPKGLGEERGKAVSSTLLSLLNGQNHRGLLLPLIVVSCVALALVLLSLAFAKGWGRGITVALILACASLPCSLASRAVSEFVLTGGSLPFKEGSHWALREAISSSVILFDVTLGLGAVVLLGGVVGALAARKKMERIPPFLDLKTESEGFFEDQAGQTPSEGTWIGAQESGDARGH